MRPNRRITMNDLQIPNLPVIELGNLIKSYEKGEDGGGVVLWFHNGYGLSISWRYGTYGGLEGAVLHEDEEDLVYDTPITSDVVGWLDRDSLIELIKDVAALPIRKYTMATEAYKRYGKYGYNDEVDLELDKLCVTVPVSGFGKKAWIFSDNSSLVRDEDFVFENPRLAME
jgi:hypothetical protein